MGADGGVYKAGERKHIPMAVLRPDSGWALVWKLLECFARKGGQGNLGDSIA